MKTENFQVLEVVEHDAITFETLEANGGRMMASIRVIRAGKSKNNRNYPAKVIKEAVEKHMFDGLRMFENHSKTPVLQRPFSEMVSAIESTSWNEADQAMDARVIFFDKSFYEKAQAAKDYMGNSINALVRGVRRPIPGGGVEEDVHGFVQPRSVDWVTFPAAGGTIHAFEGEEDNMIDWTKVTADDIKANAAAVYEAIKEEAKQEIPPPEPPKEPDPKDGDPPKGFVSKEEVGGIIAAAIAKHDEEVKKTDELKEEAARQVREAFAKAGLPEKTRARLVASFEGIEKFDEVKVTASIKEAKEELQAIGGPRITDMGPSGGDAGAQAPAFSVHESIKSEFGMTSKKDASKKSDDPKEGDK